MSSTQDDTPGTDAPSPMVAPHIFDPDHGPEASDGEVIAERLDRLAHTIAEQAEQLRAIEHAATVEPLCVSAVEAARLMGVSRAFWCKLDASGTCPEPTRLGSRTLWPVAELREWVAAGCPPREQWEQMKSWRKK